MIAVIFEVTIKPGCQQTYLEIATSLLKELTLIDGFISIERFQSFSAPEKILSLSFWRDEHAIQRWRSLESHRLAQKLGRDAVFSDYHLRVATVIRNYGMHQRQEAPNDSRQVHG